jgi:hypothetical protein
MQTLGTMHRLKRLSVGLKQPLGGPYGPTGVSHLRNLTALEDLAVDGKLTDQDLTSLASLTQLKRLRAQGEGITDRGMQSIAKLVNLEHVNLGRTSLTKRGLNVLNGLPKLRTLDVSISHRHGTIIDETPLNLSALGQVRTLELTGFSLQDTDLASLAQMPRLEWVMLQNNALTEAALVPIADLSALKHLFISNLTCTTGDGLASLTGLESISSVRLSGRITDGALNRLATLPALWSLTIETDETIRPETVTRLRERLPAIEYIHIDKPMRFDRPPVPVKKTPVRRSRPSVPRNPRRR